MHKQDKPCISFNIKKYLHIFVLLILKNEMAIKMEKENVENETL